MVGGGVGCGAMEDKYSFTRFLRIIRVREQNVIFM